MTRVPHINTLLFLEFYEYFVMYVCIYVVSTELGAVKVVDEGEVLMYSCV